MTPVRTAVRPIVCSSACILNSLDRQRQAKDLRALAGVAGLSERGQRLLLGEAANAEASARGWLLEAFLGQAGYGGEFNRPPMPRYGIVSDNTRRT